MSLERKNKDNLKAHGGVSVAPPPPTKTDDPLLFWTNHPTENTLVDLRRFAEGELTRPRIGAWSGPFNGRPKLIAQLAPAIEASCAMRGVGTQKRYLECLRAWWRLFDRVEATPTPDGRLVAPVETVADLGVHHEAAGHRHKISNGQFRAFITIANATRTLLRQPPLGWIPPGISKPIRYLIPEDQARAIKTALKQDWERVRKTWAVNDKVRKEAKRRARGEMPVDLAPEEEERLKNWQYLRRIQQQTCDLIPSGTQCYGNGKSRHTLAKNGITPPLMRAVAFPTTEEADTAFHLALMNSGWNPSTLQRIDATNPFLLSDHPKNAGHRVLTTEAGAEEGDEDATLHADKPRAGGRTQFCVGKKSHPSSPPMIVEAYLKRVGLLRKRLRRKLKVEQAKLERLRTAGAEPEAVARQLKQVQDLAFGCRCVWLYVDGHGQVSWTVVGKGNNYWISGKPGTHLDRVRTRLNRQREARAQSLAETTDVSIEEARAKLIIPKFCPSDFRDIYARWVYRASKGNILAVMLALGHKNIASTGGYLDNNIFSRENDDTIRRFGSHLFIQLGQGRVDLTILAQLVRHGPVTPEMETRLAEYRRLMCSRVGAGCADPRHPPQAVSPNHVAGRLCGTQRCLKSCPNARFLPESVDGIAMRVEELLVMLEYLPRETWLRSGFDEELAGGESLLEELFAKETVAEAREHWRQRILDGDHQIPGLGPIGTLEDAA